MNTILSSVRYLIGVKPSEECPQRTTQEVSIGVLSSASHFSPLKQANLFCVQDLRKVLKEYDPSLTGKEFREITNTRDPFCFEDDQSNALNLAIARHALKISNLPLFQRAAEHMDPNDLRTLGATHFSSLR